MGQPAEAQNRYERALKMYESLLEGKPDSVVYQSDVAMTLNNLGALLSDMGQPVVDGSICWIQKLEKRFKRSLKLKVSL